VAECCKETEILERYQYFPDAGQRVYQENRAHCGVKFKLANVSAFLDHAQRMMHDMKWSPDAIVGEYKINPKTAGLTSICTKTLYSYIDKGFMDTRNIDLLLKIGCKVRKKHSRMNRRILGESIETRPPGVATRETFSHWEIDTVIGKKSGRKSLLTLLQRKSRVFLIRSLEEHTVECVNEALMALQRDYGDEFAQVFQTIKADDGSEFYGLSDQLSSFGSKAHFCHPYSSWEKGANEKHNGMIRGLLPKGTSFADITPESIARIQNWCNNLPRKILGYLTPLQGFQAGRLTAA